MPHQRAGVGIPAILECERDAPAGHGMGLGPRERYHRGSLMLRCNEYNNHSVIDDEPQLRRTMKATLSGIGYTVLEAKSGEEALDRLTQL
jgi:hypothetical protein